MTKEEYEKQIENNDNLFATGVGDYEGYAEAQMEIKDEYIASLEAEIKKLKINQPKWTSVKDGYPTTRNAVAIYPCVFGHDFAVYNDYDKCWDTEDGDDYFCGLDEVEMWYEIPEPPKGN